MRCNTHLAGDRKGKGQQNPQGQRCSVGLVGPEAMGSRRDADAGDPNGDHH